MFIQIRNENYGYTVATYGDYVVVANPSITRYNYASSSDYATGSVDFFRYNKNTDQHDYVDVLYKHFVNIDVLLARETGSDATVRDPLHTEANNTGSTADKDIAIDKNNYTSSIDDGFGLALDMYNKLLAVGSPYYLQEVRTHAFFTTASGAAVDVFDLGRTEFLSANQDAFIFSVENPDDADITGSFGWSVSINNEWLAIGSPFISSSNGMVYMYRNTATGSNNFSWSLAQKLEASGSPSSSLFGSSLKLNKQSGSFSGSMVVGCGSISANMAFLFEYVSGSWQQTYIFLPTTDPKPLTFGNFNPYSTIMNVANGFGSSVSIFGNTVVIGAYLDRVVYEFSGSQPYFQGAAYIYEKCTGVSPTLYNLVLKTNGNEDTLKNNRLGYSVENFGNNTIIGIPKIDNETMTSCYVGGTLEQLHMCNPTLNDVLSGQAMLLQKNTSSNEWSITNVYQKKKRFLTPYREYGNDVAIADRSMVVGAPMSLLDPNREINIVTTQSADLTLDDVTGKAYIYNLANLKENFHIGNVFYRNGKIILMTSGSVFDRIFFNPINTSTYEYDLLFKSQHTIYEKQVICSVNPGEFNVSTNPSAIVFQTSSFDINGNGRFDFQDVDVLLRYMQYKNTSFLGVPVTTDWSSSLVTADDERSLLNFYRTITDNSNTSNLASSSLVRFETVDTFMQNVLDFNEDNRIDIRDMNIIWKYFVNRLTQENYATYITPSCDRKLFSDIMDHMEFLTRKNSKPQIKAAFLDYERLTALDKTGSFLAPYATSIGLYSGLDLVAIAKLGTPIKITPELPVNFVVKMDF